MVFRASDKQKSDWREEIQNDKAKVMFTGRSDGGGSDAGAVSLPQAREPAADELETLLHTSVVNHLDPAFDLHDWAQRVKVATGSKNRETPSI
jgi:hypothetical protein